MVKILENLLHTTLQILNQPHWQSDEMQRIRACDIFIAKANRSLECFDILNDSILDGYTRVVSSLACIYSDINSRRLHISNSDKTRAFLFDEPCIICRCSFLLTKYYTRHHYIYEHSICCVTEINHYCDHCDEVYDSYYCDLCGKDWGSDKCKCYSLL